MMKCRAVIGDAHIGTALGEQPGTRFIGARCRAPAVVAFVLLAVTARRNLRVKLNAGASG
jgi:hypothetical protein